MERRLHQMKRKNRFIALAMGVLLLLAAGILLLPRHYETVGVAEDLEFGMAPFEVRARWGTPDEEESCAEAPEVTYIYCGSFDSHPAVYSFTFVRVSLGYALYAANVRVDVADGGAVYDRILENLRQAYSASDSYYERVDPSGVFLGTGDGAVFVDCEISRTETTVAASAIRMW